LSRLLSSIRRYWPELLAFGGIFGVLTLLCMPDFSWINTDCDGPHYVYSAKYLYPAHKTSAPLFLLLGHLFLLIPLGMDAWRMAMLSVTASTATAVFIYLITRSYILSHPVSLDSNKYVGMIIPSRLIGYSEEGKRHKENRARLFGIIAALIWGSGALVISQSTIIESYALVSLFGAAAFYFSLKKRWVLTVCILGLGLATHHLILVPILVIILANSGIRKWRYAGLLSVFLLFYLYVPITNREPYMWLSGGNEGTNFLADNLSTAMMLVGGLAIWDIPKRIIDTIGVVGVSMGVAVVPIIWWVLKGRTGRWYREPLLWLFGLPILYYAVDLAPQTYVYVMPAIAFGAIIAGISLHRMNRKMLTALVLAGVVVLLGFNTYYFDIGRTLDPSLSARQYYDNELPKVPDGEILLTQQGWEWAMVYLYNEEEGRDIVPICAGSLPSADYQQQLRDWGVAFAVNKDDPLSTQSTNIAYSIVEQNDNVWTTVPTDPKTFGAEIVVAKGNTEYLTNIPKTITDGSVDTVWQWKPSNPYDIITGSIEVDEWVWITFSNYNVQTMTMLGVIGSVPMWVLYMVFIRKKKWTLRKGETGVHEEVMIDG